MKSHLYSSGILPLIVVSLMLARAEAQEVRTWTDKASGKTIDAAYLSADATTRTVTIKNAAGQEFTLPVARLNDADIEYIRQKLTTPPTAAGTTPAPTAKPAAPVVARKGKAAPAGPPAPPSPVFKTIPVKGFKGPSGADFVRSVPKTRPRLLHTAETWASLKARVATDPVLAKLIDTLKKGGEDLLSKPELNKIFGAEKVRGGAEGAQAMSRMATFGVLNFIDGDPKWKERAVREIIALTDKATFSDWSPDEMELCGDFTTAVALGYDWFKDGMNATQQATAKEFLIQKGMEPLAAKLEGKPVPETARTKQPGTVDTKTDTKKPTAKPVEKDDKLPPTKEEIVAASALIMASFCLADEDAAAVKNAIGAVDKIFTRGVANFAPGGVWPDGLADGDEVMDSIAMVLQTLRVSGGNDFGLSFLEGMPQAGVARLHLTGPRGIFNYGDAAGGNLTHTWVSTWLAGLHGNPGMKAAVGNGAPGANSAFFGTAGHVIYYNPWAAGDGTAAALDGAFPGAEVAALRTAWNDPAAGFIALKGGDNESPATQLDIGSFVLDLGGVRWAEELGTEGQRVPGYDPNPADRTKRHNFYIAGTKGQNTLVIGADDPPEEKDTKKPKPGAPAPKPVAPPLPGNQSLDAKGKIIGFNSTPERGVAIVDLTDAYSPKTKSTHRGAMITRGAAPSIVLQDDIMLKGTSTVEWRMHTRATIATNGNKATLTNGDPAKGGQTLTATLLSPAGASFSSEEPPEKPSEQARDLKAYHVLQVKLPEAKGEQRITVAFSMGAEAPATPVVPLTQWLPKK